MEPELRAMLTMPATLLPAAAPTEYGAAVAGAPVPLLTFIRYQVQEIAAQAGETELADGHLWLAPEAPAITRRDKLSIPGYGLAAIVGIDRVPDEAGALHHVKVYFGTPANG